MSRKVLINRLAEALNCEPHEIPDVNKLTSNQMYWMIQHEKMHKRIGATAIFKQKQQDMVVNPALLK